MTNCQCRVSFWGIESSFSTQLLSCRWRLYCILVMCCHLCAKGCLCTSKLTFLSFISIKQILLPSSFQYKQPHYNCVCIYFVIYCTTNSQLSGIQASRILCSGQKFIRKYTIFVKQSGVAHVAVLPAITSSAAHEGNLSCGMWWWVVR
jgi:hypothetical protein